MAILSAVLDANVIFRLRTCSFLLYLAKQGGVFTPIWTDRIEDEWTRNLIKKRQDLLPREVYSRRDQMNVAFPGAKVDGYEALIETVELRDPDDRHVVAAAIASESKVIVTFNLKHFPNSSLRKHGVEAVSPDEFVSRIVTTQPRKVIAAAKEQRCAEQQPKQTAAEYIQSLGRNELTKLSEFLGKHLGEI
jgi:predicted nucleic acid-binding protein